MKHSHLPDWDKDSPQLFENLSRLSHHVRLCAQGRRRPGQELACGWHTIMMKGLQTPLPHMVGTYRGGFGLEHCFVRVGFGGDPCVHPSEVKTALEVFFESFNQALDQLDAYEVTRKPDWDESFLYKILRLMAWVHTRWLSIHPFANGNGRVARLWVNYIAMRYGLPPFLLLRPRPSAPYTQQCVEAIQSGKWDIMIEVFDGMLDEVLDHLDE